MPNHYYNIEVHWTGNEGTGTSGYRKYGRNHIVKVNGKEDILLSADPAFRGDSKCYNPEELLLTSLASCHMLWYLHFCAVEGVVVIGYVDSTTGKMIEEKSGKGKFESVTLQPSVVVQHDEMIDKAIALHQKAHEYCFIANSVNFKLTCDPQVAVSGT